MEHQITERHDVQDAIPFDQLNDALEKQKIYGGRIDHQLLAPAADTASDISACLAFLPKPPKTIDQTGLSETFLVDLVLKHALIEKHFSIPVLSATVKLNQAIIAQCIDLLRNDKMVEIRSTNRSLTLINAEYRITEAGINRAAHLLEENRYIGPAPVKLTDYNKSVELQTVRSLGLEEDRLKQSFADIVISDDKLNTIGAAVNSGKPMFIYGPSGNGKSTIAKAIGDAIPGDIFIPHAILAGGQIILVYDEINHHIAGEGLAGNHDPRWIRVRRPVIFAGGELTLKSLDLEFNPTTKYYEAPLQVKANNGVFVIDDLGRQLIDPQILLNRWIVPLERRADFLTLSTGLKFEVPFDQLVIFATNISPKELADEAFLRRLRYKILIDSPNLEEYQRIFAAICRYHHIQFDGEVFRHLIANYRKHKVEPIRCHPRDLIDHVIDEAHYLNKTPVLTTEAIDKAWDTYFFSHTL
jgi:energy-coupling factor transporter ATP-binding protein EcfA2